MANKFLGLDSINVLKEYIDKQILSNEENTRLITLQVYKYVENNIIPESPIGGTFDPEGANLVYPTGWLPLKNVLNNIGDQQAIETALNNGAIWMSAGVIEGSKNFENWSTPIKISGQNGVSVRFAYSYNIDATEDERTNTPSGINSTNRTEYVWTKYADEAWSGPTIWALYNEDASDVLYRYCTTSTATRPNAPISDIDADWTNSISSSITPEKPFMWMSHKRVPANGNSEDITWSEPILFGHYGLDGNIPAYSKTLYAMTEGETPEFICNETDNINDVLETNKDTWFEIPPTGNDGNTWWYVVVNINGGDRDNPELINTVSAVSQVMRFSAIDGAQISTSYTKYLYYWSNTQLLPETTDEDWVEYPIYNETDHNGSLWMKTGVFKLNTVTGETEVISDWCTPIKITGPRGPIAYDYRTESLFGIGTKDKAPTSWMSLEAISNIGLRDGQYIWESRYLMLYKMKYADEMNPDGTYDVEVDESVAPEKISEFGKFRLSGLDGKVGADGKNGNRLNDIDYATTNKNLSIYNFDEINYFISNSSGDTNYTLVGNKFGEFISGYTGKFTNIGTGKMFITAIDANIVGSNLQVQEIIVEPQESIELISYNNNNKCEFILVGKPITDINNPIEDPGILDFTQLVEAIAAGGEVKLGKDIVLTAPIEINGNDVIVDLNGHEVNAKDAWIDESDNSTNAYAFWVKDGNLTIRGNGKVTAAAADYSMAVWCQGGNVTIESGEFSNAGESCSLIYASGTGNIVIKGGKYIATPRGEQPGTGDEYTALNLKDRDNMTCSIKVEGGHYYRFDPANNLAEDNADWWEANPNGFVADGFSSIKNGEFFSVIKNPEI